MPWVENYAVRSGIVTGKSGIVTDRSGNMTAESGKHLRSVTFGRIRRSRSTGLTGHVRRIQRSRCAGIPIHGKPVAIRCDNGPELTSYGFTEWCREKDIELRFIQPGKPDQNAFIERFNRSYREEALNAYLFDSIGEVREITDDWPDRYNAIRPHDAQGSLPPARYRERLLAAETPL